MNVKELAAWIDTRGMLNSEGCLFPVKVVDAKQAYGKTRVQVVPEHGSGTAWVDASRVLREGI